MNKNLVSYLIGFGTCAFASGVVFIRERKISKHAYDLGYATGELSGMFKAGEALAKDLKRQESNSKEESK